MSTLGSRGFSCAISGFGQVLKSDPREEDMFEDTKPSKNHGSKATQFLKEKHFQYRQYFEEEKINALVFWHTLFIEK